MMTTTTSADEQTFEERVDRLLRTTVEPDPFAPARLGPPDLTIDAWITPFRASRFSEPRVRLYVWSEWAKTPPEAADRLYELLRAAQEAHGSEYSCWFSAEFSATEPDATQLRSEDDARRFRATLEFERKASGFWTQCALM